MKHGGTLKWVFMFVLFFYSTVSGVREGVLFKLRSPFTYPSRGWFPGSTLSPEVSWDFFRPGSRSHPVSDRGSVMKSVTVLLRSFNV